MLIGGGDCRGSLPRLMDLATGRRGRVGVFQLVGRERANQAKKTRPAPTVTSLIADDPGHNQSVDVSYIAQTPDGQRRKRITIETPAQRVRSSIRL